MSLKIDRVQLEIIVQQDNARQQMLELEKQMRNANRELGKLKKQFGENSAEYKAQEKVIRDLKQQYDDLFNEIGIGHLSMKELCNRQRELNSILRNLDPSLPEWKQYNQQLKEVNDRIKQLRGTATQTSLSIGKIADGFNRYAAIGASAIASLTGLTLTMRQCVDEHAKMEEAESQVIKYTGMTREETKQLNEEFKQMDTRTPREELNRLAGEAGKLGITGVDNVREFVEAADQINVALGEDLGEDAVNQIGKLSQMFGDQSRSLKENMLAIGSAVNQVAQSTSASEPYLVEFTARMGGVGKQAGMSVTDIMGFASALDQNMLRSEMASTALSGLIMRIYQEPAKYAKLAKMDVQQFTQLVQTDVNQAVLAFLESLNKMGGMAQIAPVLKEMKLSGAEAASVITTLAGNIELVRKEQANANQAFREGTSITNEYNVQNNTVQAQLDKARKSFQEVRIELGERLQPVMKNLISFGSLTVKGLLELVKAFGEYKAAIITTTAAIGAYAVGTKAAIALDKVHTLWINRQAIAQKALNLVTKASPLGLVLAGITAITGAFITWHRKTKEVTASIRDMQKELGTEQVRLDNLFNALKKANEGTQLRRDLIKAVNDQYGQYLPYLLDEKSSLDEIESAYQRINSGLTKQMALKYKQQDIEKLMDKEGERQVESIEEMRQSLMEMARNNTIANAALADIKQVTAEFYNAGSRWQDAFGQAYHSIKQKYFGGNSISGFAAEDLETYIQSYYRMQQQLAKINAKYANWENPQPGNVLDEVVITPGSNGNPTPPASGDGGDAKAALQARLAALEQQYREEVNLLKAKYLGEELTQEEANLLKEKYLLDEKITQEEYQRQMAASEMAYLEMRKSLMMQAGQDVSAIQGQIYDKMIAEADRRREEELEQEEEWFREQDVLVKEANAKMEEHRKGEKEKGLADVRAETDPEKQMDMLQAMYDADLISYEDYQRMKDEIAEGHENERMEKAEKGLQAVSRAAQAASQVMQALQDRETSKVEAKYDKEIAAAKKAGKDTTQLEEEKEAALLEVKKKYADKQFAMNVLQILSDTAVAIMKSYATLGPVFGTVYAAIIAAQGAAQTIVAKQQRDEAKGLYEGGYAQDYIQGYTAKGNSRDVAGVIPVHKNEFVANHEAVANPAVKQFLDVFDIAQKRGTIRLLNTTQILEQARIRPGCYQGGYAATGTTAAGSRAAAQAAGQDPQVAALLEENNRLLAVIAAKELVVDSRKVRDGIRRVEQLERNVSR